MIEEFYNRKQDLQKILNRKLSKVDFSDDMSIMSCESNFQRMYKKEKRKINKVKSILRKMYYKNEQYCLSQLKSKDYYKINIIIKKLKEYKVINNELQFRKSALNILYQMICKLKGTI